jgi:hypothetical protein
MFSSTHEMLLVSVMQVHPSASVILEDWGGLIHESLMLSQSPLLPRIFYTLER